MPYPELCKSHPNKSYKFPVEEESGALIAPDGNRMVSQQEAFRGRRVVRRVTTMDGLALDLHCCRGKGGSPGRRETGASK